MIVSALAIAPVKGMRVQPADALELGPAGAAGDRRFVVVGEDGALLLSTRTPKLLQIVPRLAGGTLHLAFPDGRAVEAVPERGRRATSANYEGRPLPGHLVEGVLSEAVAEHLGRPAQLLMLDPDARGADDAPVTLMSNASLHALAPALDGAVPDPRRFRMTLRVDGTSAWAEHGWGGREIAVGGAVLRGTEPVGRCVVTTRDPDTGATDVPTLKALAALRGKGDVTFGIWCDVVAPGRVAIGDAVMVR